MEELELLKEELAEEIEAATLLLDDRLYTAESYRGLITAIGCGKAALAKENTDEEALAEAMEAIHAAVDAMELQEESTKKDPPATKKKNLTPVLVAGAFCGGLLLGKIVAKKHGRKKK